MIRSTKTTSFVYHIRSKSAKSQRFSAEYAARRYAVFLRYHCINFGVLCLGDKGTFQQRTHPCQNKLIAEEGFKSVTIHALPPWIFRSRYGSSKCGACFYMLGMIFRRPDRCDLQGIRSESDLNAQSTIADGTCHSRTFLPCVSVPEGFQRDIAYRNAVCF